VLQARDSGKSVGRCEGQGWGRCPEQTRSRQHPHRSQAFRGLHAPRESADTACEGFGSSSRHSARRRGGCAGALHVRHRNKTDPPVVEPCWRKACRQVQDESHHHETCDRPRDIGRGGGGVVRGWCAFDHPKAKSIGPRAPIPDPTDSRMGLGVRRKVSRTSGPVR